MHHRSGQVHRCTLREKQRGLPGSAAAAAAAGSTAVDALLAARRRRRWLLLLLPLAVRGAPNSSFPRVNFPAATLHLLLLAIQWRHHILSLWCNRLLLVAVVPVRRGAWGRTRRCRRRCRRCVGTGGGGGTAVHKVHVQQFRHGSLVAAFVEGVESCGFRGRATQAT